MRGREGGRGKEGGGRREGEGGRGKEAGRIVAVHENSLCDHPSCSVVPGFRSLQYPLGSGLTRRWVAWTVLLID